MVYPEREIKSIEIATASGTKDIELTLTHIGNGMILETHKNSIVFLRFVFNMKKESVDFKYEVQHEYAKDIKEIVGAIEDALGIINYLSLQSKKTAMNLML